MLNQDENKTTKTDEENDLTEVLLEKNYDPVSTSEIIDRNEDASDTNENVTCWMQLQAYACCPFVAMEDCLICLWECFKCCGKTLSNPYGLFVAVAAIVGILTYVFAFQCTMGIEITNQTQQSYGFTSIDPTSASFPKALGAGQTSKVELHGDYVSATADLTEAPWYMTVTIDRQGYHAKIDGGDDVSINGKPEISLGVCRYTLTGGGSAPSDACTQIKITNNAGINCQQTGSIQPTGTSASSSMLNAGSSVTYTLAAGNNYITADYYDGASVCGTLTATTGGTSKVDNSNNQLVYNQNNNGVCSFTYQKPNLRGGFFDSKVWDTKRSKILEAFSTSNITQPKAA